ARERLTVYPSLVLTERRRRNPSVEFVSIGDPGVEDRIETDERLLQPGSGQPEADGLTATGRHVQCVVGCGLRADSRRIDRARAARNDGRVKRILDIWRSAGLSPETLHIALV